MLTCMLQAATTARLAFCAAVLADAARPVLRRKIRQREAQLEAQAEQVCLQCHAQFGVSFSCSQHYN